MLRRREVTISQLRRDFPEWSWTAKQHGFGSWRYRGCNKDDVAVEVYAVSVLINEFDDCETQWRVDTGEASIGYASWWMENRRN